MPSFCFQETSPSILYPETSTQSVVGCLLSQIAARAKRTRVATMVKALHDAISAGIGIQRTNYSASQSFLLFRILLPSF